MRVIAGQFGGRNLATPKGDATRPTTDRVKESLMSSLASLDAFDNAYVLDAFAGSGGLGIEALSRGAAFADFFDKNSQAQRAIKSNLASLGLDSQTTHLSSADIFIHPPLHPKSPYTLIFLDPPYAISPTEVFSLLETIRTGSAMATSALISYEHDAHVDIQSILDSLNLPYTVLKHKTFGDIAIDIMRSVS